MTLSNNEIVNITTSYMLDFDLEEKHSNNIKEILKNHGNKPFYIYHYILFVKSFFYYYRKLAGTPSRFPHGKNIYFWINFKKLVTYN